MMPTRPCESAETARFMRRIPLLVPVVCAMSVQALDFVQTSWDSTGVSGPVREWAGGFQSSFGIDWQSSPGTLTLDRLGSCMSMGCMGSGVADVACGDIDGDGDDDIAALEYGGRISWYENPGDGRSFVIHSVLPSPGSGHDRIALFDIEGDGDLDAAASSNGLSPLTLYIDQGSDLWLAAPLQEAAAGARALASFDMDGDGDADIATGLCEEGEIVWLENPGTAGVDWPLHRVSSGFGSPWSVDAADCDADGDADMLAASSSESSIALFEQDSGSWRRIPVAESRCPICAVFTDLDGDGTLDAATASSQDDEVLACVRRGWSWTVSVAGRGLTAPEEIVSCDLDGDGDTDLAAVSNAAGELAWWENLGDGEFAPRAAGTMPGLSSIDAGDIDGDGMPELVTGSMESCSVAWWEVLDRARSGGLTSAILYIGPDPGHGSIEWDASIPVGTSAHLFVRVAPSRLQMGEWNEVADGRMTLDELLSRGCAFLQYRLELSSTDPSLTPTVREVRVQVDPGHSP